MKALKIGILIIFLCGLFHAISAQNVKKDSIQLLIEDDYEIAEKILDLLQESRSYLKTSSTQVRKYALQALHYSEQEKDTLNIALSYNYLGASYVMEYSYDTAFNILYKGLVLAEKQNIPRAQAKLYNNIATIYEMENNDRQAFKYYEKAVETLHSAHISGIYLPKLSLGEYYCKQGKANKAAFIQKEVLQDATAHHDTSMMILSKLNMLESFCHQNKKTIEERLLLLNDVYKLSLSSKIRKYDVEIKKLYIAILIEKKDFQSAIDTAVKLVEKKLNFKTKRAVYAMITQAYEDLNHYSKALYYQKKLDSIVERNYSLILEKSSHNQQAVYQLSNQKLILGQIKKDRETEKNLFLRNRVLIKYGPYVVVVLLLIIFLLIIFFLNEVEKNKKHIAKQQKLNRHSYEYYDKGSDVLNYLGMAVFQMNEKYMYLKANDEFLQYAHKSDMRSLIGSTDFDLHWNEYAEKLVKEYELTRGGLDVHIVDGGLMKLPDNFSICLIPLIKNGMFIGIQGMIAKKSFLTEKDDKIQEMKETHSNVEDHAITEDKSAKSVLIVDDEPDNLLLMKLYLANADIEAKLVGGGVQAIEEAKKTYFDYILLDINMPDLGGVETAKEIRSHSLCTTSNIIALTASVNDDGALVKTEVFDSIMHKPISKSKLFSKLSISLKSQ